MNTRLALRIPLALLALGAALGAQAVTIGLSSVGTFLAPLPENRISFSEEVINQQKGYGPLTNLALSFNFATSDYSGTYTGTGGTLNFNVSGITSTSDINGDDLTATYAAKWQYLSGTGTYSNLTGSGTLAVVFMTTVSGLLSNAPIEGDSYTTFRGVLHPVPEPASMAALGLGVAALVRRRKRA